MTGDDLANFLSLLNRGVHALESIATSVQTLAATVDETRASIGVDVVVRDIEQPAIDSLKVLG